MRVFLSHNRVDKTVARRLGADMVLAGADVWFDEWEIRAGDSVPGKLNEGLAGFDVFVLVWSANAARSDWVARELESAISRAIGDKSTRIIPVVVDETPLPPLIEPLRRLALEDGFAAAVDAIMGLDGDRDRRRAIQNSIEDAGLEIETFHGYGPLVGCPRCGAGLRSMKAWSVTDHQRDDVYAGAECKECGWSGGGEI